MFEIIKVLVATIWRERACWLIKEKNNPK